VTCAPLSSGKCDVDCDSATIGAFMGGMALGVLLTGLFCSFIFEPKRKGK
jgi:hypothetical protein